MGTTLARAYVQIAPSAEGIKQQLTDILGKEVGGAGEEAGKTLGNSLVSKIKGVIAAAGIGSAIKSSLMEGANLQQSIGGIETLFKDSADTVIANAKNAYKTAGMSANQYMETVTSFSASLLQGLSGDTNKAAIVADMALTDMSDNANKMGTSMELIQNAYQGFAKQNYTMLDNLKLGYGGTKTEMERLLADAEKISGVKYDISNLSDVYNAIHVIQEEMDITGTTAKEASETFSGAFASMKAAASNVLANLALGEPINQSLFELRETIHTFVFNNLMPMFGNILSSLPDVISQALTLIIGSLNVMSHNTDKIMKIGTDLITGIVTAILTKIPYIVESAYKLVSEFAKTIVSTDWIEVANDLISNLREELDLAAGEILGTDGNIVESFINAISNGLPKVLEKGIDVVLSLVSGIIESLPEVVTSATSIISNLLSTILANAPKLLESGITLISKLAAGLIKSAPSLIAKIPGIISDIKKTFTSINWGEVGKNIISGIAKGILNGVGTILSAAKEAAKSALKAAKNALGIKSPSRLFENEVGKMIDLGLAAGIENNIDSVSDSMKELSKSTVGMIDVNDYVPVQKNIEIGGRSISDNLMDSIQILVENNVTVDGTPLKVKISDYTISRINSTQMSLLKAKGGM